VATDLVRPIRRGPSQCDSIPLSHNLKLGGQCDRSIEDSLHWVLDVTFHEDRSRIKKENAPENCGLLRRLALCLLKKETTSKRSIKGKRLQAGWDDGYLQRILTGNAGN
jgi:hypothetical protein